MTKLVVDASVALGWVVPSQSTGRGKALLLKARTYLFVAPLVFAIEVRNALLKAGRRGILIASQFDRGLSLLGQIEIQVETNADDQLYAGVFEIARSQQLGFYDAFCIELSKRRGVPLASRNGPQLDAAAKYGVPVMDVTGLPA